MNRAWIPAGALAGVSVAGLIALGPLTDSLSTQVQFPKSVDAPPPLSHATKAVPVSVDLGTVGNNTTAADFRGGAAASTGSANADSGEVALQKTPGTASHTQASTFSPQSAVKLKVTPPKKVNRKTLIGASSGPNGDSGFTSGGSAGTAGRGESSSTPSSDAP